MKRALFSPRCYDPSPWQSVPESGIAAARIRAAVTEMLEAVGDDPTREGLVDTPRRIAEM